MRIVQLTDLHLPPAGTQTNLKIDTRQNFLDMLPRVAALQPDLLVVSGDLCFDVADTPTYHWIREHLEALGIPYAVIAGNHDTSVTMGEAFGLNVQQEEVYFTKTAGDQPVIFLDTAVATISDTQLEWLEEQMAVQRGPLILFMHHPPFPVGMPFMDRNWPFHRSAGLLSVLTRYPAPVYVFCGHYHTERVAHIENVCVHITPSLYFQLHPDHVEPTVEHTRIALRLIDFQENRLFSAIRYFDGNTY